MFEARNLSFAYKDRNVISDFSIRIDKGEILSVLAPSGKGKTTLALLLSTLLKADSGTLYLDGINLYSLKGKRLNAMRRKIAFVPQNPLSSFDNLLTIRKGIEILSPSSDWKEYVSVFFNDGDKLLDKYPSQLSGGEIQRFAIIRSLSLKPEVLIMDEITSSLDPLNSSLILSTISALTEKNSLSSVFFTNDERAASYLGGRIINLP